MVETWSNGRRYRPLTHVGRLVGKMMHGIPAASRVEAQHRAHVKRLVFNPLQRKLTGQDWAGE